MSRWFSRLVASLRSLVYRHRADIELGEELQFHLDREIEEGIKAGLSQRQARQAALRAMGALEANKEACRDERTGQRLSRFVDGLRQDVRFGLRLIRRNPVPVSIAIGGLATAIAVVTGCFSIVNATLLRPYGMDDPESVVAIAPPGEIFMGGWPYSTYLRMKEGTSEAVVEAQLERRARLSAARSIEDGPEHAMAFVSGGYLQTLGGRPSMGRALAPSDDEPGAPPVMVVSQRFFEGDLKGDPEALGRTLWINGVAVTLVGVLRAGFTGPTREAPSAWAPLSIVDDVHMGLPFGEAGSNGTPVRVIARLSAPGRMIAVQQQISRVVEQLKPAAAGRETDSATRGVRIFSAASPAAGPDEPDRLFSLVAIFSIAGLILLLACANTANLLMASAMARVREVGVRLALGATRRRLVRQMVSESLVLAMIAGALGFAIAFALVPIFGSMVAVSPEISLAPDGRVLLFTLGIALACGLGAGLSPARHGARGRVSAALQTGSGRGGNAVPARLRTTFVGVQAAVSMLLLVLAALAARAAIHLDYSRVGFDADRLIAIELSPQTAAVDQRTYIQAAVVALHDVPAVSAISVTRDVPFVSMVSGRTYLAGNRPVRMLTIRADAAYFQTAGLPILRGRTFTDSEVAQDAPVALVNDSAARALYGEADPIGQVLPAAPRRDDTAPQPLRIVGVVGDAVLKLYQETGNALFRPMSPATNPRDWYTDAGIPIFPYLMIRTATPGVTVHDAEQRLRRVDSRVQPAGLIVRSALDEHARGRRGLAVLVGSPALLALLLAAFGIYGVTAFMLSQRTEEVSVRMAMGATSSDILRLLVADSLRPVLIGAIAGLGVGVLIARVMASELEGISPFDPAAIGIAAVSLILFAAAAVIVPARRAAVFEPARLLRQG